MEIEPVFKSYGGVKLAGWQQGRFCKGVGIAQGGSATNVDPVQPVQDLTVVFVLYRSERHLSIAGGFFFEHKHKQDQGDLCRSPGFYFDLDFILRKFLDFVTFQLG